ncbi:MAG: tetratricopeptide repeat protein [Pseudomonadota bacterium]
MRSMKMNVTTWMRLSLVLLLALAVGACDPATTKEETRDGNPQIDPEEQHRLEAEKKKQAEEDKRRDELRRSLEKREIIVPEKPEFVPGVDIEAQKSFRDGVISLFSMMDYESAVTSFEEAITKDKAFLEAYFNLGMVYERTRQPEKALEVYQRALDANPESGTAKGYIGKVYLGMAKEKYDVGQDIEADNLTKRAKELFDQVIVQDQDNSEANNALALYWLLRTEHEGDEANRLEYLNRAEDFIENVLAVKPTDVVALNTRGLIYMQRGEYTIAKWVFENKVLKLDNGSTEAHNNLGLAYYKLAETPKAVRHFRVAIQLNESNLSARLNLAAIYLNYLNYEKALEQYDYVLNARPDNVEAMIGKGSCHVGDADYDEGFTWWQKAVTADNTKLELVDRIAKIYATRLTDFDKAAEAYDQYIALAQPQGLDISEAQKAKENTLKLKEQMRKMEEQMKEEAEAQKALQEKITKRKDEMEREYKVASSTAGQYVKQLDEKIAAIKANKAATPDDKKKLKSYAAMTKQLQDIKPDEKLAEIGENLQYMMLPEAEVVFKALMEMYTPVLAAAEALLEVKEVQAESTGEKKPEDGEEKKPEPKPEEPKKPETATEAAAVGAVPPPTVEAKPEEAKPEEAKPEEVKPEEVKPVVPAVPEVAPEPVIPDVEPEG